MRHSISPHIRTLRLQTEIQAPFFIMGSGSAVIFAMIGFADGIVQDAGMSFGDRVGQWFCELINMSQQNRRFAANKPTTSPPTNQNIDIAQEQPYPQPVQNSINQSSISTSTLPEAPPDFQPQELSIHISSDGRKKLVNSRGEESMIYPFCNKFFGDYGRGAADRVGEHNRQSTIGGLKKQYLDSFKVSPNSKIYNYNPLEIHLLSQFYQNLIGEGEKQQIIKEYATLKAENKRMKTIVLLFSAYVVATHRTKWSRLTANNQLRFNFYLIGGMLWAKSYIDLGAFQVNSIIEHNKTYENMLSTYENDYKIAY